MSTKRSGLKVSLSFELTEIEAALGGIQMLLEPTCREPVRDGTDGLTVRGAAALLAMVAARTRHVRRAISGIVSPREILADHNAVADCDPPGEQTDIVLEVS
jgi:hypothetical protein